MKANVNILAKPHSYIFFTLVRQCLGVFLNVSWQFMVWPGNEASMTLLVALCYMKSLQQLKQLVGVDCRLMIVSLKYMA